MAMTDEQKVEFKARMKAAREAKKVQDTSQKTPTGEKVTSADSATDTTSEPTSTSEPKAGTGSPELDAPGGSVLRGDLLKCKII